MHQVKYHKRAAKSLRKIPADRSQKIRETINDLATYEDPTTHPDVKIMRGDWDGSWRLRVGEYRAVFRLSEIDGEEVAILILVTHVGSRGDIYYVCLQGQLKWRRLVKKAGVCF